MLDSTPLKIPLQCAKDANKAHINRPLESEIVQIVRQVFKTVVLSATLVLRGTPAEVQQIAPNVAVAPMPHSTSTVGCPNARIVPWGFTFGMKEVLFKVFAPNARMDISKMK